MSFPAWSSFATGLGPGRHGLFDFTQKLPGAYRLRFTNASDRLGATLFARASRAGRRVLALGMPASYPPEPVDGLLVSGFDAPVSTGTDARSASDPGLYRAVAARTGAWMRPEIDEAALAEGWHERAVGVLLARIARKRDFALEALAQLRAAAGGARPALACVVFSESDTVAHHYWRDHDPASPRHDPAASATRRGAVTAVYEALDAACGELRAAYGEDALCAVVSDHGSGGAAAPRGVSEPPARGVRAAAATGRRPRGQRPARPPGARPRAARASAPAGGAGLPPRALRRRAPRERGALRRLRLARDPGLLGGGQHAARRLDQPARARGRGLRRALRLRARAGRGDRRAARLEAARRRRGGGARPAARGGLRGPLRRARARRRRRAGAGRGLRSLAGGDALGFAPVPRRCGSSSPSSWPAAAGAA